MNEREKEELARLANSWLPTDDEQPSNEGRMAELALKSLRCVSVAQDAMREMTRVDGDGEPVLRQDEMFELAKALKGRLAPEEA